MLIRYVVHELFHGFAPADLRDAHERLVRENGYHQNVSEDNEWGPGLGPEEMYLTGRTCGCVPSGSCARTPEGRTHDASADWAGIPHRSYMNV